MSVVEVRSHLRREDGTFVPFHDLSSFAGDCHYVPGAIELTVGGVEVLSLALWDDINWLWPYVVQALDECRRTGQGERFFPDQPLKFRAESLGASGQLLLSVTGGSINNRAVGPADDIYEEVAREVTRFFASLRRLCPPMSPADDQVVETARSWVAVEDP